MGDFFMRNLICVFVLLGGLLPGVALGICYPDPVPGSDTPAVYAELQLSELAPVPTDGEEFIELLISSAGSLEDWKVRDASGKEATVVEGVQTNGYVLLWQSTSKIYLNNSGDIIELIHPSGEVVAVVEYGALDSGNTWALVNNSWVESVATPGTANIGIPTEIPDEEDEPEENPDPEEEEEGEEVPKLTVAQVKELEKGEFAQVEGIVTAPFGLVGSRSAYIQDESGGIQIYISRGDVPDLEEGSLILMEGKRSSYLEEERLLTSQEDIQILETVTIEPIYTEALDIGLVGSLVSTSGTVLEKSSSSLTLDSDVIIYRKSSSDVSFSGINTGDHVQITGIVSRSKENIRILPRYQTDIQAPEELAGDIELISQANAAEIQADEGVAGEKSSKNKMITYGIGLLLAASYLIYRNKERIQGVLYPIFKKNKRGKKEILAKKA